MGHGRTCRSTVTVKRLTSLNPFGFHFTGKKGAKMVIDSVDAFDKRGGHGNNSDGVSAASGTVVKNSYFESGDDIFKVYSDIKVLNSTVKMIDNTVPIQLGWGDYGNGAKGEFVNLEIIGNSGRFAADKAVIAARHGKYNKTLTFKGLKVANQNAALMNFRNDGGTASITITKADIKVKKFRGKDWKMKVSPKVCGKIYNNGQGAPKNIKCN
ncbi:MAG: hypothetical protein AAGF11_10020 [Myxococcota bacterium]